MRTLLIAAFGLSFGASRLIDPAEIDRFVRAIPVVKDAFAPDSSSWASVDRLPNPFKLEHPLLPCPDGWETSDALYPLWKASVERYTGWSGVLVCEDTRAGGQKTTSLERPWGSLKISRGKFLPGRLAGISYYRVDGQTQVYFAQVEMTGFRPNQTAASTINCGFPRPNEMMLGPPEPSCSVSVRDATSGKTRIRPAETYFENKAFVVLPPRTGWQFRLGSAIDQRLGVWLGSDSGLQEFDRAVCVALFWGFIGTYLLLAAMANKLGAISRTVGDSCGPKAIEVTIAGAFLPRDMSFPVIDYAQTCYEHRSRVTRFARWERLSIIVGHIPVCWNHQWWVLLGNWFSSRRR